MEEKEVTLTPRDFNEALFELFYADLERGTLAQVPEPTPEERAACLQEREEILSRLFPQGVENVPMTRSMRMNLANEQIPIDVVLRVEKTFDHYFRNLKPLLGMVHQCQRAKQRLYEALGYQWYTTADIYPGLLID